MLSSIPLFPKFDFQIEYRSLHSFCINIENISLILYFKICNIFDFSDCLSVMFECFLEEEFWLEFEDWDIVISEVSVESSFQPR